MSAEEEIKANIVSPAMPTEPADNNQANTADTQSAEGTATDAPSEEASEVDEATPSEEGEILEEEPKEYKWCKCFAASEQQQVYGQDYYFMHFDTREVRLQEPSEPYWIWDPYLQNVHPSGLQQPSNGEQSATSAPPTSEPDQEYHGYNPAIHGDYDPTAPYAKYHEEKRRAQLAAETYDQPTLVQQPGDYSAVGAFNRWSNSFQTADKSADRHSDYNKSLRQVNSIFNYDGLANAHDGKSLKAERREQHLNKKELAKMREKRRQRKEKKRLDFYKS